MCLGGDGHLEGQAAGSFRAAAPRPLPKAADPAQSLAGVAIVIVIVVVVVVLVIQEASGSHGRTVGA